MTAKELIEKDRFEFFKVVQNPSTSLAELIAYYVGYIGPIFGDQKFHFKNRFIHFFSEKGLDFDRYELIQQNGALNPDFLRNFFPAFATRYYEPVSIDGLAKLELLPGSENKLVNNDLPPALNQRSWKPSRSPLVAFVRSGGSLFISPNGYQYFDEQLNCYWTHASTRPYSNAVAALPRHHVSGLVVLVQDIGDGTNFAHFTFDWVTRIMYILSLGLIDKSNALFVMGGDRTEYHNIIIAVLREFYNLSDEQFYFPQQPEMLVIGGTFTFFSDQLLWQLHPAQMAHPRSMKFLREIASAIPRTTAPGPQRIFISRRDASLRKISNEEELISIASNLGFEIICMTDFPAIVQINLIRGARIIVGAHGMGLTHIIFNDGPLALLELFHPELGTDAYSLIARAQSFDYNFIIGTKINDNKGSYYIDTVSFLAKITEIVQRS